MFICDDGDELFYPDTFNNFPLSSHKSMLKDRQRLDCFSAACTELVRPGHVVVDAGTGTGVLAFLALKAGAKRVVGLDSSAVIKLAKQVKDHNFPDAKLSFRRVDLMTGRLPQIRADVVLCETLGYFGIDEGIVKIAKRLRRYSMKANGVIVPSEIRLRVCPVESKQLHGLTGFWRRRIRGLDFSPIESSAFRSIYAFAKKKFKSLAAPCELGSVTLDARGELPPLDCRFEMRSGGILHGFVGWFEARLSPSVVLSTDPAVNGTHWANVYFPVGEPIEVDRGDVGSFHLRISGPPENGNWGWSGELAGNHRRAGSPRKFNLSTPCRH